MSHAKAKFPVHSHDVWQCGGRKLVVRARTALAMEPGEDVDRLLRSELIGPQEKTVPWRNNGKRSSKFLNVADLTI